jgi:hypothetical protein
LPLDFLPLALPLNPRHSCIASGSSSLSSSFWLSYIPCRPTHSIPSLRTSHTSSHYDTYAGHPTLAETFLEALAAIPKSRTGSHLHSTPDREICDSIFRDWAHMAHYTV